MFVMNGGVAAVVVGIIVFMMLKSDSVVGSLCSEAFMPNTLLKCIFKSILNSINFCHINAGSWFPKIDEIRWIFEDVGAYVIAINKSWLKTGHSNKSVSIPEYNQFRANHFKRRGGEVSLYVHESLNARNVTNSHFKNKLPPCKPFITDYLIIELIFLSVNLNQGIRRSGQNYKWICP